MKRILTCLLAFSAYFLFSAHTNKKNDEGMFPLSELKNLELQKLGLKISPEELYNPKGTSLIDAIVQVGGCTGSFVSDEGLIVTNHHCAFSFVQAISNTENNYIKQGFLAGTREKEVPAEGLVCRITASYADVSDRVLKGTENVSDPAERLKLITFNTRMVVKDESDANPGLQCEVSEMFTGKTYVLFRYRQLKDVRLVYVPPRSIGEYGGELDNWVWPRHSGDFAFLRAYVGPNGETATYNKNNVPYKPARFLKVNPKGVNENDFVFILGYPGRTFRHQPAAFYKYHEQYMLKYISDLFDWQIAKMEDMGKGNESLQIKYASKIKRLANTTKNYKGKLQGFRRAGIFKHKEEEEKALADFVQHDPELSKKYSNVIPRINELYTDIIRYAPKDLWFGQMYNISPTIYLGSTLSMYQEQYKKLKSKNEKAAFIADSKQRLKAALGRYMGNYDPEFEKAAIRKMIEDASQFNADNHIKWVEAFNKAAKGDVDGYIESLFKKSKLTKLEEMQKLIDEQPEKLAELKDPFISLADALTKEVTSDDEMQNKRDGELNLLMAKYVDARSVWKKKQFIPDANSTLRFTYGFVKGYYPNDGEYNKPFTTLKGVIEKEDDKEYELLQVIKDLYASKDYGAYLHPGLNDLPVNILYDLDTTGGNSGSPVMNDKGELIAVNFDRAFTATINDYAWNETYSRSVGVDIRYVLWVLQKVAKADHVVKELAQQ